MAQVQCRIFLESSRSQVSFRGSMMACEAAVNSGVENASAAVSPPSAPSASPPAAAKRRRVLLRGVKPVKNTQIGRDGKPKTRSPTSPRSERKTTGKIYKHAKQSATEKQDKRGKIAKMSKRRSTRDYGKVTSSKRRRARSGAAAFTSSMCLLSIKASIVGHPEVKVPVWRPSIIPESATVDKVVRLWAERTFGTLLRTTEMPAGVRCYAGGETRKLLDLRVELKKLKSRLPLENGRLSMHIVWPILETGATLETPGMALSKNSWAIKRREGDEPFSLAKALALYPEERKRRRPYICFANLKDACTDPDCPYPHMRMY